MTARAAGLRRVAVAGLIGGAAVAGLLAVPGSFSDTERLEALGLAVVLALCLQLHIDVVEGSRASVGNGVAVALAVLLHPGPAAAVFLAGLALAAPPWVARFGIRRTVRATLWVAASMVAAVGAQAGVLHLVQWVGMHGEVALLLRVAGAGVGFLAVELGGHWLAGVWSIGAPSARSGPPGLALLGLHLAILCAAALLVLASRQLGPASAVIAAIPLLIIHFSFVRYARARRTYDQAVLALSIVPEVAGHAGLGHGERTAFYATALTRSFRLETGLAERVVTAARIHHIGRVLDEQTSVTERVRRSPGEAAGELLAEIPFLQDVASLVAAVEAAPPGQVDVPCAIIRVASTFDELTDGSEPDVNAACSTLLALHRADQEQLVAARLVQLWKEQPALVLDARRAGRYLPTSQASDLSEFQHL